MVLSNWEPPFCLVLLTDLDSGLGAWGFRSTDLWLFSSKCSAGSKDSAILWQPVAYSSNFKEKETAMFQKLMKTSDDFVVTLLRLALGVVFFAHGAQKALGWFGGYGFQASLGFFTQMMHIPAPLAVLAIAAEFLGGIGLLVGFLGRVAAFGIATNMVLAIILVHRHVGFFANWSGTQKGEGYEYHILAIIICLAIMIRGSGALSIDRSASKQLA
jgi:putative oxidoreductase